jgi:hypothetical protein
VNKFSSKYGNVRNYYPKPDVAVEVFTLTDSMRIAYIRRRPNLEDNKRG